MFGWLSRKNQTGEADEKPRRFGHYDVGEIIGKGGAGLVYLATNSKTGQVVALKTLRPHAAHDEQFDRRFLREMFILQRLDHPNLLKYLDCGVAEQGAYIVMEFVPKGTLSQVLNKHSILPGTTVLQNVLQLSRALDYLHSQGIVHRDLKPANVFMADEHVIKLGDFGLALDQTKASLTVAGMTVGSVLYMSPEQIRGKKSTPQSDLYSLGCVIYEMLYGVPPFKLNDPYSIMEMHLESNVRFPDERLTRRDPASDLARQLIQDLMQKNPDHRPTSANEVIERILNSSKEGSSKIS